MQNKRSLKNVVLTKKYHWLYIGKMMTLSWALVVLLYGALISRVYTLYEAGVDVPMTGFLIGGTAIALALMAAIGVMGVLTAHRVAGPHIKLRNTFDAIAEGNLDQPLRFRKDDQLEEVEESFNNMMDRLRERLRKAEGAPVAAE
ncbi:MAG: HAMP domain-containing protein [Candidatus Eremiobacteraeota bacterium]|nr:HAMP domain-containing protein [Candidatus Eremiobacteraeota bacterium]